MIEKKIIKFMKDKGWNIYAERPKTPPSVFLLVERINTRKEVNFQRVEIAVQVIADTLLDVIEKNEQMIEDMLQLVELSEVSYCRLTNSYNYTSTKTKEHKYQTTFSIGYYIKEKE